MVASGQFSAYPFPTSNDFPPPATILKYPANILLYIYIYIFHYLLVLITLIYYLTFQKYSHAKAEKDLGINFTPISTTIVDMAKAMIDLGIVEKK